MSQCWMTDWKPCRTQQARLANTEQSRYTVPFESEVEGDKHADLIHHRHQRIGVRRLRSYRVLSRPSAWLSCRCRFAFYHLTILFLGSLCVCRFARAIRRHFYNCVGMRSRRAAEQVTGHVAIHVLPRNTRCGRGQLEGLVAEEADWLSHARNTCRPSYTGWDVLKFVHCVAAMAPLCSIRSYCFHFPIPMFYGGYSRPGTRNAVPF